ncbi:hypothetical protein [Pontiella sp.]|uniref:hypothetical protein n=1 Tax=Pontiella sp. TaxID=2837462 RepID=UPI003567211F
MRSWINRSCVLLMLMISGSVSGQIAEDRPGLMIEEKQEPSAVTRVYGLTAEDYLPDTTPGDFLNPNVRRSASRPSFDLPDAFFFIGGPVFLLILLRVLVIFLNGFEEKRKEEENQAASEHFNPD